MPIYTFYLCNLDGSSNSFEAIELTGDEMAVERAPTLLREHPNCAYVAVWEGDRPIHALHRRPPGQDARERADVG